jgi:hypothetical protein
MARGRVGDPRRGRNFFVLIVSHRLMRRVALVIIVLLAVPAAAHADPPQVKPDRAAIGRLLDEFVPDVVAQKNLKRGWGLVAGPARATSYRDWIRGDTSVQRYPAKGTRFHGFIVNYSYPGDVGFDILLQPTTSKLGAWSFRAEAQKIGGRWRITTWYPVAEFAPPHSRSQVVGPNDFRAGSGGGGATDSPRLSGWVLLLPGVAAVALALGAVGFALIRWARRRGRVRAIQRELAR